MAAKEPAIVAELGRPETPEETAARKAENSRLYRARKTWPNLLFSLLVCAVAVAVIVFLVPRDDSPVARNVDYLAAAAQAQPAVPAPLAAPTTPDNWASNEAELRQGADGVQEWYIGFVVSDERGVAREFVGLSQAYAANPSWISQRVNQRKETGSIELGGVSWTVYDHLALPESDRGNTGYCLVAELGGSTVVVYGSDSAEPAQQLATAVAEQLT